MKVFTHGGVFHADEVLAIATIQHITGNSCEVVRGFQVPENWDGLVLDIGREYNPEKGLFDHHQNPELDATNILILEHFVQDEKKVELLKKHLYQIVSDVDRGICTGGGEAGSFYSIIRSFNNLENGFDVALNVALKVVEAAFKTAEMAIEAEETWEKSAKNGKVAINLSGKFMPNWKEMAKKDGICFLVEPNPRGGYQVTSVDSSTNPIPAHETQTFIHNSGFMAVYATLHEAINHASSL